MPASRRYCGTGTGGTPDAGSLRSNDIPVVGGWRDMDRIVHVSRMPARPLFSVKLAELDATPALVRNGSANARIAWENEPSPLPLNGRCRFLSIML